MTLSGKSDVQDWRIILCHKHPFSARMSFLVPDGAGVVFPDPLPPLAVIAGTAQDPQIQRHPSVALRHLQELIGVNRTISLVGEFELFIETADGLLPVYLAALEGNELFEPPAGMRWVELLQCVQRPWLERELLRRAYDAMMTG